MASLEIHEAADDPQKILRRVFGFSSFRGLQEAVVEQVCAGGHALVVMPTGSGKSLCYQIPAIARPGTAIVVSPLIALMQDQVAALRELGVRAATLNSAQDAELSRQAIRAMQQEELDLLYVAPERLLMDSFLELLDNCRLSLFAIDEAHCISEWGHDFRPEYHRLGLLAERFPAIPRVALTATADAPTRRDIIDRLALHDGRDFLGGFDRPNIRYGVQPKTTARRQLLDFVKAQGGEAGIVYCLSRARTEEVASWLTDQGISALPYHAGLAPEVRARHQERFLKEPGLTIAATIAFGMGIDKPDVRFVAHLDPPRSLEAYYQETGRAGRDGLPAETLLLFGMQDIAQQRRMIEESNAPDARKRLEHRKLDALLGYAETTRCRRQVLLDYFGDSCEACGNCDTCLSPPQTFDGTVAAQKALSTIYRTGQRYGSAHVIDVLLGKTSDKIRAAGHDQLSTFGIGTDFDAKAWRSILRQLASLGLLHIDLEGYGALRLTEKSRPVLRGEEQVSLRREVGARRKATASGGSSGAAAATLESEAERSLFTALRARRLELAREVNLPPYMIFHDSTLVAMAQSRPGSRAALGQLPGVGESKLERYGAAFLEVIAHADQG
ncbi:DNA helicase RecQ [Aquibaculum arenosum]|uniref:DNA helicase RecQ n=1 Tax=Aquibaculum arenosum TaxID=3032591 RepID=A0ABT5YQ23_9PROT|nr:DNA helicase RecQ [Fodinicurvata sp. CAU 1616]MDF2097071.1 DNA helicase RecQ [Fodinicurvata sp. CAU 1616]